MSYPTRRVPGGNPGHRQTIEQERTDNTKRTAPVHDPAFCAECRDGVQPWTEERWDGARSNAARAGRQLAEVLC